VPRQERHPPAADLADGDGRRRLSVGRLDVDGLDIGEERVEARPSEDPDVGGAQADFPFDSPLEECEDPVEPEEPVEEPEESDAEPDDEPEEEDEDVDAGCFDPFESPPPPSDALLGRLSVR
jgi:hypothetical protein